MATKGTYADLVKNILSPRITESLRRKGLEYVCTACGRLAGDHSQLEIEHCSTVMGSRPGSGLREIESSAQNGHYSGQGWRHAPFHRKRSSKK